ncbi:MULTISPECIES: hypothetical protein [unclassified Streptomyces]|uniref:hypothetical protein n=1 Tax=unclassified Streptomyces TaxID=2593676 RepID=UPI00332333B1
MGFEEDHAVQGAFDVLTAADAVERCAAQARVGARRGDRLVGIASDAFRDRLRLDLKQRAEVHTDVDAWLRMRGISIAWVAGSAPGAWVDEAGSPAEVLDLPEGLRLWPAAEEW